MSDKKMLQFKSGGWVLLLALLVSIAFGVRVLLPSLETDRAPIIGDKENVATYGFDLANLQISAETLVTGNMPKDGMASLDMPAHMTTAGVARRNADQRGKYLVSSDWILGLHIDGESRAYPLRVLNWHEVVNDELAGRQVAVTFNPLSFVAVAFDRERNGEILEFGVSGLVWNSSMLLYDRREGARGESLWLPLQARPVAGPAVDDGAGGLKVLPLSLTTWSDWTRRYPDTTVIDGVMIRRKHYGKEPYASYYQRRMLRFPVSGGVPDGPHGMTRCLVYRGGESVYCLPLLPAAVADAELPSELQGLIDLVQVGNDIHVQVRTGAEIPGDLSYAFWFAHYAGQSESPAHGLSSR